MTVGTPLAPAAQEQEQTESLEKYTDIPEEYWIEAENFKAYCDKDYRLKTNYDCECFAMKFLDARIDFGPYVTRSQIMMEIGNSCISAVNIAGESYTECMAAPTLVPGRHDPEEFCSCVANAYAKLYDRAGVSFTSKTRVALKSRAMASCTDASR